MSPEATEQIPGLNVHVEPGDAAPPVGEPFDPEKNFDMDLGPSLRVIKRGDKVTIINTSGLTLFKAVEALKKLREKEAELLDSLDIPPDPEPVPAPEPTPGYAGQPA